MARSAAGDDDRVSDAGVRRGGRAARAWSSSSRPIAATCSTIRGGTRRFRSGSTTRPRRVDAILERPRGAADRRRARRRRSADGRSPRGCAQALGLPGTRRGRRGRAQQAADARAPARAGLPVPWFVDGADRRRPGRELAADAVAFPCVVKPLALSGSRGVMRADDEAALRRGVRAAARAARVARRPGRARRGRTTRVLVEGFIPGREFAARRAAGPRRAAGARALRQARSARRPVLRGDDLRDAVVGAARDRRRRSPTAVARAADAIGLRHGPVHAECRVNDARRVRARGRGAADRRPVRPRAAVRARRRPETDRRSRSCCCGTRSANRPSAWRREARGVGRDDDSDPAARHLPAASTGVDEARAVPGVDDVRITAKADQLLVPLPEGASYLGFIFARGATRRRGRTRAARRRTRGCASRSIPNCVSSAR